MAGTGFVARVLLETSVPRLDHLFDYRIPEHLAVTALPGVRVRVPLGGAGRIANGYLIDRALSGPDAATDYSGTVSDLEEVVSPARVLQPEVWSLARRIADRGAGSANDVLRLAIPPRQVRVEKAWLAAQADPSNQEAGAEPAAEPSAEPAAEPSAEPAAEPSAEPAGRGGDAPPIRGYRSRRLETAIAARERLAVSAIPRLSRLPSGDWVGEWAVTMATAAARTLAGGQSAILVVPDYRDQEQLACALAALVAPEAISRVDARQGNPDRYRAFLACLGARPRVIVGNRSAVYLPAARLGLIAVWDDGDPLHAEPLAPYAHTRDVALIRQEEQGCALLFLGHTRSVEVQRLVGLGWLGEVKPDPAVAPRMIVTSQQDGGDGQPARIPSAAWREARAALEHGPVLVQVARPGYAPVLACQRCKNAVRCTRCAGPLGLKSATAPPACLWCGAIAADWVCPHCQATRLRLVSLGAGRTAEELGRAFPGFRVIVADGDHPLLTVGGEPALVVATRGAEPIAPGGYRAVLLLDGERMLARESLHVGDDCLRWWSNAAALAAPGAPTALVGVGGAVATALSTWRQEAYASAELADRRALRFPPAVRTASVAGHPDAVEGAIATLEAADIIDVLGPVAVAQPASPGSGAGSGGGVSGGDGTIRAIVRFEYAHGAAVAAALRAAVVRNAVVRNATGRKKPPIGAGGRADRYRPAPTLKVRFDDPEIL